MMFILWMLLIVSGLAVFWRSHHVDLWGSLFYFAIFLFTLHALMNLRGIAP